MYSLTRALALLLLLPLAACETGEQLEPITDTEPEAAVLTWETMQDDADRVAVIEGGLLGPEGVRYDPEQDVYFVSNFNGEVSGDANGFISRVAAADGTIEEVQFMVGTEEHPLHAPRGMYIVGDTLWATDADGLHGFHRETGEHLAFVDFTAHEPGFLNDIVQGPDDALYITDTGASRLYRLADGEITQVSADTLLGPPNGITLDPDTGNLLLAPWSDEGTFRAWSVEGDSLVDVGMSETGGNFDGVEVVDGHVLLTSQADSSLYVMTDGVARPIIKMSGRPADQGVDTQRMRVAVPFVALNRVDIWALPQE